MIRVVIKLRYFSVKNFCRSQEEALQQIRDSTPFTGTGTLTLGQGSCGYTVTSQGGQNRTITSINVTSWQEVADF